MVVVVVVGADGGSVEIPVTVVPPNLVVDDRYCNDDDGNTMDGTVIWWNGRV